MGLADETLLGIRIWALATSAAILALAGLADALLRWIVRRRLRRGEAAATAAPASGRRLLLVWFDRGLAAAIPPVALLLWVLGAYFAVSLVLTDLETAVPPWAARAAGWARTAGVLTAIFWLLLRIGRVIEDGFASLAPRTSNAWDDALLPIAGTAVRVLLPILAVILAVPVLSIPDEYRSLLRTSFSLLLIGVTAFLLYRVVEAAETIVLQRYEFDASDNLKARAVYTQVTVLKKIAVAVIGIFALASMLMVFDTVRQFGASILASAGIAGIIIGFAAQRSIATLLAGLQIAITQPIRLDDVVIVEHEWGRIEDITLTYVTVRIWDQRRLIVPITYFIEQPFQNWTRTSADILGTVFLYVDYRAPLDAIRDELDRILRSSPSWDGKVKGLQVTNAREHTLEIRALASAANASLAWDLRCEVREKRVEFLQRHHPEGLPRVRAEMQPALAGAKGV
jgi:small-conductance mechanosensitive channel